MVPPPPPLLLLLLLLLLSAGQLLALGARHGEPPLGHKWAPLNNGPPDDDNNDNKSHCSDRHRYGPAIWRYGKAAAAANDTMTTTAATTGARHNGLLAAEGNNINIGDAPPKCRSADGRGPIEAPRASEIDSYSYSYSYSRSRGPPDVEEGARGRQRVGHRNDQGVARPPPQAPAGASEPTSGGHIRSAAAQSISGGARSHSGHVGRLIGARAGLGRRARAADEGGGGGGGGNLRRQQQLRVASILQHRPQHHFQAQHQPRHQNQHQHQHQHSHQQEAGGCPSECQCKWRGGKQAADCSWRRLARPPAGLDPLTQVLNLTGNPLGQLHRATFASLHLNNLQRIHLSSCQLGQIGAGAFEGLRLVVELELSWNGLSQVPLAQMSQLKLLRKLSMRGNALGALDESSLGPVAAAAPAAAAPAPGPANASADALARLAETFPGLLWAGQELGAPPSGQAEVESNFIIRIPSAPVASPPPPPPPAPDEEDNVETLAGSGNQEEAARGETAHSLGFHLSQLQELDFGQCKLTYIKWWALENLGQLKRLWLDGNQLSQLSGRLVGALPPGLHQLALEGNPFICDCRLLALKRWLQATRTPLAAPVRCHRHHHQRRRRRRRRRHSTGHLSRQRRATGLTSPAELESKSLAADDVEEGRDEEAEETSLEAAEPRRAPPVKGTQQRRHFFLAELGLDNFVCPPQAVGGPGGLGGPGAPDGQQPANRLHQLIHYLWPTLVRRRQEAGALGQPPPPPPPPDNGGRAAGPSQQLQAAEADRVSLKCPLLACPGWSVHFVWLADYQGPGRGRDVVLYDSRQQRAANATGELALQGGRILVSEWRARDQDGNCFKESRLLIQAAHADDSARYRCVGLNKAGNASLEFALQVHSSPASQQQRQGPGSGQRDQRANQEWEARRQVIQAAAQQQQQQDPTRAKLTPVPPPPSSQSAWLKGSTTFQVTIVLVSVLMGAVVLAFLLFCIVIYQIKPTQAPPQAPLPLTLVGSPHGLLVPQQQQQLYSAATFQTYEKAPSATRQVATGVRCDPATGGQAAHHFYGAQELEQAGYRPHKSAQL